jgi:hypothetical protein
MGRSLAMPIQQINFNTSSFTGTKQRESVGEGLSKLVMTGLKGYSDYKATEKKFTEEEDAELGKTQLMAYNDIVLEQHRKELEDDFASMDYGSKLNYRYKQKQELADKTKDFNSSWFNTKKASILTTFDNSIGELQSKYNKDITSKMIEHQLPALLLDNTSTEQDYKMFADNLRTVNSSITDGQIVDGSIKQLKSMLSNIPDSKYTPEQGDNLASGLLQYTKDKDKINEINSLIEDKNDKYIKTISKEKSDYVTSLIFNDATTESELKDARKNIYSLGKEYAETKYTLLGRIDSRIADIKKQKQSADILDVVNSKSNIDNIEKQQNNGRVLTEEDVSVLNKDFNTLLKSATTDKQKQSLLLQQKNILDRNTLVNDISDAYGTNNYQKITEYTTDTLNKDIAMKTMNNLMNNAVSNFIKNPSIETAIIIKKRADSISGTPDAIVQSKKKLDGEMEFKSIEEVKAMTMLNEVYAKNGGAISDLYATTEIGKILAETKIDDNEKLLKVNKFLKTRKENKDTILTSKDFVKLKEKIEYDYIDQKVSNVTLNSLYRYMAQNGDINMYAEDEDFVRLASDYLIPTDESFTSALRSITPFMERTELVLPMNYTNSKGVNVPTSTSDISIFLDDYADRNNVDRRDLKVSSTLDDSGKPQLVITNGKFSETFTGSDIYSKSLQKQMDEANQRKENTKKNMEAIKNRKTIFMD